MNYKNGLSSLEKIIGKTLHTQSILLKKTEGEGRTHGNKKDFPTN